MQPLGYYAGFLSEKDQQAINAADIGGLAGVAVDLADNLWSKYQEHEDFSFLDITYPESDHDKVALIRGICDRIEIKLMEAAK